MRKKKKIAIVGIDGLPAKYGGFETLVENLVKYHYNSNLDVEIYVFCSLGSYDNHVRTFLRAKLIYLPISANGVSSIIYDGISLLYSVFLRCDTILILGYSGSIFLPLIKCIYSARFITNMDGIEWKRSKWSWLAKKYLKLSEFIAVKFSDILVADNYGIEIYYKENYSSNCEIIPYGGDHAINIEEKDINNYELPDSYALAIARIEPENNIDMILQAFSDRSLLPIVFIGNFSSTIHGQTIKSKYRNHQKIILLESIYDIGILKSIRLKAQIYIHGHSAGGTNPSLVEIMHFNKPIAAYDCNYNRHTTHNKAFYFKNSEELRNIINSFPSIALSESGEILKSIAQKNYTWEDVGKKYFQLMLSNKKT